MALNRVGQFEFDEKKGELEGEFDPQSNETHADPTRCFSIEERGVFELSALELALLTLGVHAPHTALATHSFLLSMEHIEGFACELGLFALRRYLKSISL